MNRRLTPIMSWASWNCFKTNINEERLKRQADALISTGLKMIADYAHKKGLQAGIYSDGGDSTCAFYNDGEGETGINVGLYGYEDQDLKMYLEDFEFDFKSMIKKILL